MAKSDARTELALFLPPHCSGRDPFSDLQPFGCMSSHFTSFFNSSSSPTTERPPHSIAATADDLRDASRSSDEEEEDLDVEDLLWAAQVSVSISIQLSGPVRCSWRSSGEGWKGDARWRNVHAAV